VHAVDASPEMLEQARRRLAREGVAVTLELAYADALPYPDAHFDVVFSTLMLHHLPRPMRQRLASETRRVLKPGGRILAVDFAVAAHQSKGLIARVHRHGGVPLADIVALLGEAGLTTVESGPVGVSDLQFALATAPGGDGARGAATAASRSLAPLPTPRWFVPALVLAVVALHAIVFGIARSGLGLPVAAIVIVALLVAAVRLHGPGRRRARR
jgi:SAM-dependent methyltransferase